MNINNNIIIQMKSIKLSMAVLALAAAFTACTKEEAPVQQEIQSSEFVGAKLLGTNISANFDFVSDAQTKVDANGDWEQGDKLGLAWIVEGDDAMAVQTGANPTNNNIYANHLFTKGTENFTTYGNVFEGWHFAYYPFQYMKQPGQALIVDVNPTQTEVFDTDKYTTRAYVSVPKFLTAKENLDENNQLVFEDGEKYDFMMAVKTLGVKLQLDKSILNNTQLNTRKIKSVTLSLTSGGKIFYSGKKQFNPTALVRLADIKEEDFNPYVALDRAWVAGDAQSSISTTVECDDINLGADQMVRFYTLPIAGKVPAVKDLALTVEVEGGHFYVPFVLDEDTTDEIVPTAIEEANNEVFRKLARAFYEKDEKGNEIGYLASYANNPDAPYMGLNFTLTADKFVPHFDDIASEDEWDMAVALVNTLGKENVTFKITKDWSFTKDITLPNIPLTVTGNAMKLDGVENWPAQTVKNGKVTNFIVNTNVIVKDDLNVAGVMTVEGTNTITNNATIYAGANSNISRLDNKDRVIVEFGAKININAGGTIAYVVENAEKETILNINTLIDTEANSNQIEVNTLIVKTALGLNAEATSASNGAYGNVSATNLKDLSNIYIELDGGSLTATSAKKNVYEVKAVAGNTAITGVNIVNNVLNVAAGTMTATNVVLDAADEITVAEGAELTITDSSNTNKTINKLTVDGKATINIAGSTIKELVVDATGDLVVSDGSQVVWTNKCELNGTTKGIIAKGATNMDELRALMFVANNNSTVYVAGDFVISDLDVFSNDKNATINLNRTTLTVNNTDVTKNVKVSNGIIASPLLFEANEVSFTNVKFDIATMPASTAYADGPINVLSGKVTIDNCIFNTVKRPLTVVTGFAGELNVTNSSFQKRTGVSYDNVNYPYINGFTGKIKLTGCTFAMPLSVEFIGSESRTTIAGNNFEALELIQYVYKTNSWVKCKPPVNCILQSL